MDLSSIIVCLVYNLLDSCWIKIIVSCHARVNGRHGLTVQRRYVKHRHAA